MGLLVHDEVELPNFGFSVSDFIVTCKGSYQLSKESIQVNGETQNTYHIHTKLYFSLPSGIIPFDSEAFSISVNELPADIFDYIYANVKTRYNSTTDI